MLDIGTRSVVPGANDNGTGVVALLAIAAELHRERVADLQRH
jgi:Zn-dependent M28 family amino/carboxypeptidase